MHRSLLLFFILFSLPVAMFAQSYVISGTVTDTRNNDPIPFATVYIKGGNAKVLTDFDGNYKLRLKHVADFVSVSCLGYKKWVVKVDHKVKQQVINFVLVPVDTTALQKRAMSKNQLHALSIVKKVIERKDTYNKGKVNAYGYEVYTKIENALVDINERFQHRKFFRPFRFAWEHIDSASENKPFLPFFISEVVSDYYFQKKPLAGREIIKASKISGLDDINISQFLGASFAESNIYSDYIQILKREFLSPISSGGVNSYNYYLEDTQVVDKFKCYRIRFIPKSPKLLRLEGEMWVTDTGYAIKQISVRVHGSSNINLINSITLFNAFIPVRDSIWMLQSEKLNIELSRTEGWPQMVVRKTAFYKNFIIDPSKGSIDSLFRNGRPNVSLADSADLKSEAYWQHVRKAAEANSNEEQVYHMIDTLGRLKATRRYIDLLQVLFTGFINAGPVAVGNVYSLAGRNSIQGLHFKLGLRTNSRFSRSIRLSAYAGYGLLDKKVRYGGEVLWVVKKYPRISFLAGYRYDLMPNPNAPSFFTTPQFFTTYGIRRVENGHFIPMKLMDNREFKFQFYQEFKFGLSYTLGFKNQVLQPLANFNFSYHTDADNMNPNTDIDKITTTEFSIRTRFAFRERYVGNSFKRYSLGSKFPVLLLEYAAGVKDVWNSQFRYHRIEFGLQDTRFMGPFGKLRWNIEVGKVFGTVPYLLLHSPDASETYVSWWPGFNTISKYQFTADRYVKAMIEHHLEGFIFDRIPGFNKLKWREVWNAKMWWGDLTNSNRTANYANLAENPNNIGMVRVQTADKVPFIEMSAGIENIFSFFRVDAVWRVTHLDPTGTRFSFRKGNCGVRIAFEAQF